ncbi:MAG: hypothetical protein JW946_04405 [Candidatus Omnitrophica bacterium]|nr:hypothetical protein [Candidatus Omnitrophota bacterium]
MKIIKRPPFLFVKILLIITIIVFSTNVSYSSAPSFKTYTLRAISAKNTTIKVDNNSCLLNSEQLLARGEVRRIAPEELEPVFVVIKKIQTVSRYQWLVAEKDRLRAKLEALLAKLRDLGEKSGVRIRLESKFPALRHIKAGRRTRHLARKQYKKLKSVLGELEALEKTITDLYAIVYRDEIAEKERISNEVDARRKIISDLREAMGQLRKEYNAVLTQYKGFCIDDLLAKKTRLTGKLKDLRQQQAMLFGTGITEQERRLSSNIKIAERYLAFTEALLSRPENVKVIKDIEAVLFSIDLVNNNLRTVNNEIAQLTRKKDTRSSRDVKLAEIFMDYNIKFEDINFDESWECNGYRYIRCDVKPEGKDIKKVVFVLSSDNHLIALDEDFRPWLSSAEGSDLTAKHITANQSMKFSNGYMLFPEANILLSVGSDNAASVYKMEAGKFRYTGNLLYLSQGGFLKEINGLFLVYTGYMGEMGDASAEIGFDFPSLLIFDPKTNTVRRLARLGWSNKTKVADISIFETDFLAVAYESPHAGTSVRIEIFDLTTGNLAKPEKIHSLLLSAA